MPIDLTLHRRSLGLGLAAAAMQGCVNRPTPPVLVNLADLPSPHDEARESKLDTGLDSSRRMTAPVRINGMGPFNFVVDTGANRSVIASELAAELSLPEAGRASVHGVSGVESSATSVIDLLEVDAVSTRAIRAPNLPRAALGADGLLGVDVFRNRRVVMDFVRDQLLISADAKRSREPSTFDMRRQSTGVTPPDLGLRIVVPARYRFGQLIIIGADVSGRRVTAFIDSGSQSTVGNMALRRLVYRGSEVLKPVLFEVPILSATGQVSMGELGTLPLLRIGGLSITHLTAAFADLHVFDIWDLAKQPSLLLGMDVLRQFSAIELNYPRQEVAFYLRGTAGKASRGS